jgi:hypothetical protein
LRSTASDPPTVPTRAIKVAGTFDRLDAEALALEIRRLARVHGIELTRLSVERAEDE